MLHDIFEARYLKEVLRGVDPTKTPPTACRRPTKGALERYNPYEALTDTETPPTYYEALALFSTFRPLSCNNFINEVETAVVDLDDSNGFATAIQQRYPKVYSYALPKDYPGAPSINGPLTTVEGPRRALDWSRIDQSSYNLKSLSAECLRHAEGVPLVFVNDSRSADLEEKCAYGVELLETTGVLMVRLADPSLPSSLKVFETHASKFGRWTLHRPSSMSCLTRDCYLILEDYLGSQTSSLSGEDLKAYQEQVEILTAARYHAAAAINAGASNLLRCNVQAARSILQGY